MPHEDLAHPVSARVKWRSFSRRSSQNFGRDVAERQGVVVDDHLGLPRRPGGEVNDKRVARSGLLHPAHGDEPAGDGRRVLLLLAVADPAREVGVDHQAGAEARALGADLLDFGCVLVVRDYHPDLGRVDPVFQVLSGQHRGAGAEDRPELDAGEREYPPLRDPCQHDDHPVTLLDAVLEEHVRRGVGEVHHLPEGERLLVSLLVDPDHREPVPVLCGETVDLVEPEVVVFRDLEGEVIIDFPVIVHVVLRCSHMN